MAKLIITITTFMVLSACSLMLLASAEAEERFEEEAPRTYTHTWPKMEFGWRIVLGTIMAFCGAAFGSVGGVGGAGIIIPMLTLVIGFDAKSSAAMSKCMTMSCAVAALYHNIKKRHPTLNMPVIDYDLALLFQPMLVLGISFGVTLNVIFANWMVTVLLIVLCLVTAIIAFHKGMKKWKTETIRKEADRRLKSPELPNNTITDATENHSLPGCPNKQAKVYIIENVHWKKLGVGVCVWIAILALQIFKSRTSNCSRIYWVLNFLQIPVVTAASGYEAMMLYKGKRVIASRGEKGVHFKASQLALYCFVGVLAGTIGGTVGLGGGVILGPLFLQMGVPPQVTSATAMFVVTFSSSMSVVEYYLLKRFPIPYTVYFVGVSFVGALVGQHIVKKLVEILGRESLIIFALALIFFTSAFFIGGEGVNDMIHKIKHHEYMGLEGLCSHH